MHGNEAEAVRECTTQCRKKLAEQEIASEVIDNTNKAKMRKIK